jgi:hypothetical protein
LDWIHFGEREYRQVGIQESWLMALAYWLPPSKSQSKRGAGRPLSMTLQPIFRQRPQAV